SWADSHRTTSDQRRNNSERARAFGAVGVYSREQSLSAVASFAGRGSSTYAQDHAQTTAGFLAWFDRVQRQSWHCPTRAVNRAWSFSPVPTTGCKKALISLPRQFVQR